MEIHQNLIVEITKTSDETFNKSGKNYVNITQSNHQKRLGMSFYYIKQMGGGGGQATKFAKRCNTISHTRTSSLENFNVKL